MRVRDFCGARDARLMKSKGPCSSTEQHCAKFAVAWALLAKSITPSLLLAVARTVLRLMLSASADHVPSAALRLQQPRRRSIATNETYTQ
jgi:hypothetical protein